MEADYHYEKCRIGASDWDLYPHVAMWKEDIDRVPFGEEVLQTGVYAPCWKFRRMPNDPLLAEIVLARLNKK